MSGQRTGMQETLAARRTAITLIAVRDADNTLELEADHRRHAEIENAIRDPASSAGRLSRAWDSTISPSGRFAANAAWLAIQSLPRTRYGVIAHNLARWTARISLGDQQATTKTRPWRIFPCDG